MQYVGVRAAKKKQVNIATQAYSIRPGVTQQSIIPHNSNSNNAVAIQTSLLLHFIFMTSKKSDCQQKDLLNVVISICVQFLQVFTVCFYFSSKKASQFSISSTRGTEDKQYQVYDQDYDVEASAATSIGIIIGITICINSSIGGDVPLPIHLLTLVEASEKEFGIGIGKGIRNRNRNRRQVVHLSQIDNGYRISDDDGWLLIMGAILGRMIGLSQC